MWAIRVLGVMSLAGACAAATGCTSTIAGDDPPPPPSMQPPGTGSGSTAPGGYGALPMARCTATCGPVVLALSLGSPDDLAVDGEFVYWTSDDGTVTKAPTVERGAPITLATGQHDPTGIAVADGRVYWANRDSGQIMSVATTGGTPSVVSEQANTSPYRLAIRDGLLYWLDQRGTIMRAGIDGSGAVALATAQGGIGDLALTSDRLYWTGTLSNTIRSLPLDLSAPVRIDATARDLPFALAAEGDSVYWANSNDVNGSMVVGLDPSAAPAVIGRTGDASAVAADPAYVYWSDEVYGAIVRVSRTGGKPETVATDQAPWSIRADAVNLYWVTVDGEIVKLEKY